MRGDVAPGVRGAVDLAMIEDSLGVAEEEVHIPFDVAVGKVLPRGNAVISIWSAVAAAGIDSVLVAQ